MPTQNHAFYLYDIKDPTVCRILFFFLFFSRKEKNWLPIWLPARTTQKVFLRTHNGMISILKEQSYYCTYTFTLDLNLNTTWSNWCFISNSWKYIYLLVTYYKKITLLLQKKIHPIVKTRDIRLLYSLEPLKM